MDQPFKSLVKLLIGRVSNGIHTLNNLQTSSISQASLTDEVKMMREIESAKIRAVIDEQKDLLAVIEMIAPGSLPAPVKENNLADPETPETKPALPDGKAKIKNNKPVKSKIKPVVKKVTPETKPALPDGKA